MPKSRLRKKKPSYTPESAIAERKAVKIGPKPWIAPLMLGLFLFGLLWIVVFYIAGPDVPIMNTIGGAYNALVNVLIGFAFITAGFIVSTKWR